ncbi:MAG: CaiB/BaiF CoA transferase family protein [Alphaproteobacteria bacterium]|jgi:crotonobetainyl-CoA:carnitine CoA-transferase CaiB-like acyl-CoA transferase
MEDGHTGGALAGITVLALEQAVAAPYCTSRLADAGARVIKVERAEGDFARGYDRAARGMSSYFAWLNRGKESLVADIKAAGDAALLHRILAHADVFVQNLLPGAAARAGFGSGELRARHPRLVTVDISGYGDEGPYAAMKSYDMLVQAETGLASITGGPEAPARAGVSVCDIAAGMYAHQAVLEALIRRGRTGEGASIKVSLFDGMADWMAVPLLFSDYGPGAPRRVGLSHPSVAPYDPFPSADGTPVLISIQNDREWQRFCAEVLELPGLASDPAFSTNVQRVANRARMDAIIREGFARHGTEALCARLLAAGIAFARVNSVADFSRHPQLRRVRVQTPAGEIALPAPPPVVDGERAPALGPVPALDAHGEAIRREFGA